MATGSATVYLLWAVLAILLFTFLITHLWLYDRFKCLKWGSRRPEGAFNRLMTYCYFTSIPLLLVFSVAMAVLKYKEGLLVTSEGTIVSRPTDYWDPRNKRWLLPLCFVLSFAWALELVTHLEELTFWLFLLNQRPGKGGWFNSWEFRLWYIGSMVAILGVPTMTLIQRHDLDQCLGWIFSLGSAAGTLTTIFFLYVLYKFPAFLRHVKTDGAEPDVVVRLIIFYQLNIARVLFRFIFTVPLLILGLDAIIRGNHPINQSNFWADFLLMLGGIGCVMSSAITLLIFFPRSATRESGFVIRVVSTHAGNKSLPIISFPQYNDELDIVAPKSVIGPDVRIASAMYAESSRRSSRQSSLEHQQQDEGGEHAVIDALPSVQLHRARSSEAMGVRDPMAMHDRRARRGTSCVASPRNSDLEAVGRSSEEIAELPINVLCASTSSRHLNPYVATFTSSIDISHTPERDDQLLPRLRPP